MKEKLNRLIERLMSMLGGAAAPAMAILILLLPALPLALGAIAPDRLTNKPRAQIGAGVAQDSDFNFDVGQGASNPRLRYKNSDASLELNKGILRFGTGVAANQVFEADKGLGATNPKLQYNNTSSKWQFSDNGSAYVDFGAASVADSHVHVLNTGLSASVSANALTVALKQKDGSTDPTGGSPASIGFRSSTSTSGLYTVRTVTAALSIVIPSGTTIGTQSTVAHFIYIYALDNAGTVELALSLAQFPTESIQSSSAIAGGSSATTLYSTTARANVPIRLIGRINITQTVAGTWATGQTELSLASVFNPKDPKVYYKFMGIGGRGSVNTAIQYFATVSSSNTDATKSMTCDGTSTTLGASCTINIPGMYQFTYCGSINTGNNGMAITKNASNLTVTPFSLTEPEILIASNQGAAFQTCLTIPYLSTVGGEVIRPQRDGNTISSGVGAVDNSFTAVRIF